MSRRLWWVLDATPQPGGTAAIRVAPAGRYQRSEWILVDVGDPLLAALGVAEPSEVDAGGELARSLVGRLLCRREGGARAREWEAWPTPGGKTRPLILADRTSHRPWGLRPLEGASGGRLADLVGMGPISALLGTFETFNAAADPAGAVLAARGRHVVIAGRRAAEALAEEMGVPEGRLPSAMGPASWAYVAHPSGRSTAMNHPLARRSVASILAFACMRARGLPSPEDTHVRRTWEEGPWTLGPAWTAMRDAGLAADPAEPSLAWHIDARHRLGPKVAHWARERGVLGMRRLWWRAWSDGHVLVLVQGDTWRGFVLAPREGRVVLSPRDGGVCTPWESCGGGEDLEDAILGVESEARWRGIPSPWDAREDMLSGTCPEERAAHRAD